MGSEGRLRVGEWRVDPTAGEISRGGETVRLDARTMRLLLELAARPGETLSLDELLERVWAGVIVTPDSVYQAVAALRRLLGDDRRRPRYIATVPRLGYRLVAEVAPWFDTPPPRARRPGPAWLAGAAALAAVVVLAAGLVAGGALQLGRPPSVGVMPFLDFSDAMDQEPLADAVTEGVVDRLAKRTELVTAGFRSSVSLKGRRLSPPQAARALGVGYVVEGTVRTPAGRVKVAARLVRARDGIVLWTEDYERPADDVTPIEDAIARAVGARLAR